MNVNVEDFVQHRIEVNNEAVYHRCGGKSILVTADHISCLGCGWRIDRQRGMLYAVQPHEEVRGDVFEEV